MLDTGWFKDSCKHITNNKNIWVAYSGGVDSHVLLKLASLAFPKVHAVHINHGLSSNANIWQRHCETVCVGLNIKLHCITVNAKPKAKQSPEDAARIARRAAWQNLLTSEDILLLAHHADDQAETILYRLFRGTGPKGLSGMALQSKLGAVSLFRPLLAISKQDILKYAAQNKLKYISDESNIDNKYDRNYIRNQLLPHITQRWPAAVANINRAGKLNLQLLDCVKPVVQEKLISVLGNNNRELNLIKLQECSEIWRTEILRAWLQLANINPSFKQINLIKQQVIAAKIDANPRLNLDSVSVRRSNNKLYILTPVPTAELFEAVWDLNQVLTLPGGAELTTQQISAQPEFINKLHTQQVTVKLGAHGSKAKKIFQQFAIPAWERYKYPLVFANGRLVAIVGLWVNARF